MSADTPTPTLGVSLGAMRPSQWRATTQLADELGFESVWLSDHLVAPLRVAGELRPGAGDVVKPTTPLHDPPVTIADLAARCDRLRFGTYVYLLGLRHPFVAARAWATLDVVTGGRVVLGVGAGWLTSEWDAAGVPPARRGARLDEAIVVCRRLWDEDRIEHDGPEFPFETVGFRPKPTNRSIPVHVGGESEAALRRAARLGDGWMGMGHTADSVRPKLSRLAALRDAAGRAETPFEVSVGGAPRSRAELSDLAAAGVDRVIVAPTGDAAAVATTLRDLAALSNGG